MTSTITDAQANIHDILSWYHDLGHTTTGHRSLAYTTPSTATETRLPFGLDAHFDTLDDGPTGIRTPSGATEFMRVMASWLHTSGYPANLPNQNAPGTWIRTMLETPYPWQTWPEWEDWAEDLRIARKTIARLTGNTPQRAGSCPKCAGTLITRPGHTKEDSLYCPTCYKTFTGDEWHDAWQQTMRAIIDPNIFVTRQQLLAIWDGVITSENLKNYVRRSQILRGPGGLFRLAAANLWLADYHSTA